MQLTLLTLHAVPCVPYTAILIEKNTEILK